MTFSGYLRCCRLRAFFFNQGNKLLEIKDTRDAGEKGMHDEFLRFRTLELQQ